ncbi:MAG: aromatic amino acid transport family protein [Patescibacteria group bacterium]|jgi:amino acid permease
MAKERSAFFRSVQALIGVVIGVGIFGLPYVFSQSGFAIGVGHLVFIAVINAVVLFSVADLLIHTPGHHRLTGLLERYLGPIWKHVGTLILFASSWGAMLAYIIIGGQFLDSLCGSWLGGNELMYQIIFYLFSSIILIGGFGFISRFESIFSSVLLIAICVLLIGASPEIETSALTTVDWSNWFLPFGVVLFAFGGLSALPEMAQILGKEKHRLKYSVVVGLFIVAVIYLAFATVVLSVTGTHTTEESMIGLGRALGPWALIIGSFVGLISVATSFIMIGLSMINTLVYDYRLSYLASWALVIGTPGLLFLIGARDFIDVIGFSGSLLGGILGILIIAMYWHAKKHAVSIRRFLRIPRWVLVPCALLYFAGIILTILNA